MRGKKAKLLKKIAQLQGAGLPQSEIDKGYKHLKQQYRGLLDVKPKQ